jgi:hypothetical protein
MSLCPPHDPTSPCYHVPLNTRQDGRNIISRTPPILQYVQTQLARPVNIRVEHLADKLDARRFVGVCFLEVHDEAESAVFEGSVCGADYDCVPIVCGSDRV